MLLLACWWTVNSKNSKGLPDDMTTTLVHLLPCPAHGQTNGTGHKATRESMKWNVPPAQSRNAHLGCDTWQSENGKRTIMAAAAAAQQKKRERKNVIRRKNGLGDTQLTRLTSFHIPIDQSSFRLCLASQMVLNILGCGALFLSPISHCSHNFVLFRSFFSSI